MALCIIYSPAASALEFQCKAYDQLRRLRVEIPGKEHLCEVTVTHNESGVREVKWYARNDTLFCSARAYELRDKYQDVWNYTCTTLPDDDGIDHLSAAQRLILDQRLKQHINDGKNANPAYRILSVRAVASTPLDKQAAKIALQFFTDKGDFTEIIDDQVQTWNILNTIDNLTSYVTSDVPVQSALMHNISDQGAIEIHTQLNYGDETVCHGRQILTPADNDAATLAGSPHRFSCEPRAGQRNAMNDPNSLEPLNPPQ